MKPMSEAEKDLCTVCGHRQIDHGDPQWSETCSWGECPCEMFVRKSEGTMGQCDGESVRKILRDNFFSSINSILDALKNVKDRPEEVSELADLFEMYAKDTSECLYAFNILTDKEWKDVMDRVNDISIWSEKAEMEAG